MLVDWSAVEDSSDENRRLGRAVRWLGRFHESDPSIHWAGSGRWRGDLCQACLASEFFERSLGETLEGAAYNVGGDEHYVVRLEAMSKRVFKITHGDAFGCTTYFSPHDPDLTGRNFHGTLNDDPSFYLRRWMLLNYIGGFQTRFEGFLPPEGRLTLPRICISQPAIEGENPHPDEIRRSLRPFGFERISQDTFLQSQTTILLTDTAPRNVRIVDGVPVLFDAIAMLATDRILAWVGRGRSARPVAISTSAR